MMNYPALDNKLPAPYSGGLQNTLGSAATKGPSTYSTGLSTTVDYSKLLSTKEKKELEIPMSLYVNIKLLNTIESLYSREYITQSQYNEKWQQILDKIANLENILANLKPGFTIESFIEEYGLQDCIFAKSKLTQAKKGTLGVNDNQKLFLVASITSNFLKIGDLYYLNNEQYPVKDVMPAIQQMAQEMNQIKRCFTREFNLGSRYQVLITKYGNRDISSMLSKDESKEVFDINQFAQNEFQLFLKQ